MIPDNLNFIAWWIVAGAALAVEVAAHVARSPLQGIEAAVRAVARHRVGRTVLLLGWGWLGWHLFVR